MINAQISVRPNRVAGRQESMEIGNAALNRPVVNGCGSQSRSRYVASTCASVSNRSPSVHGRPFQPVREAVEGYLSKVQAKREAWCNQYDRRIHAWAFRVRG